MTPGGPGAVTVGDGSANSAEGEMFAAPFTAAFPTITLANSGDKIEFTGTMQLTGAINSPATSGAPRTQFRFGLFDGDVVGPDDNGWVGYYMSNRHGNAGSPAGVLALKPVSNTSVYLSSTGQTTLGSLGGDGTAVSLFHDGAYSMSLSIERLGADLLITGTLTSVGGFSQTISATDTTAGTAGTYSFDRLGFLLGGNLDADQAVFSNLTIRSNVIPEPAAWALQLLALVGGGLVRRQLR
jgi:hypothetical protein